MVKSNNWCTMEKGGVDNKNIHTALFSSFIFAIIFILSDIIKYELNKKNLHHNTVIILSFIIHFFLIIIVTLFVIFIFKIIYNFGDNFFNCK